MTVAIHQPQYMPYLGYFDKIARADHFVLLDHVQYKKNEFQNRNKIKTAQGWQWLTVPVRYKFPMRILDVSVDSDVPWRRKHPQALISNYGRAPFFAQYQPLFEALYAREWNMLSDLNRATIDLLIDVFGVTTPIHNARTWPLSDDPTGRLIDICKHLNADTYLSGAGGRDYLDQAQFERAGIHLSFHAYKHPVYSQQFVGFEPYMSAIDLLFNCGPESGRILREGQMQ